MTINPSDLQNPLVLLLARIQYSSDSFQTATPTFQQTIATSNPVAVTRFVHYTCRAMLDGLLRSKPGEPRILSDVSNYFGVVESNGRGMHHLHALIWSRGYLDFIHLRDRILADSHFATRMIWYLETIIMHGLHDVAPHHSDVHISRQPPSATGPESDLEFLQILSQDRNLVATNTLQPVSNTVNIGQPNTLVDSARLVTSSSGPRLTSMVLSTLLVVVHGWTRGIQLLPAASAQIATSPGSQLCPSRYL
ncbi:hypothetical protein BJX70DRAFT_311391 [Aspergillus crustosus]